ncbi:unnamed protein product [Ectocarpus sp. 8 AP-2014]
MGVTRNTQEGLSIYVCTSNKEGALWQRLGHVCYSPKRALFLIRELPFYITQYYTSSSIQATETAAGQQVLRTPHARNTKNRSQKYTGVCGALLQARRLVMPPTARRWQPHKIFTSRR